MKRGLCRYRPSENPSWWRWISFAMRQYHSREMVEMMSVLDTLNEVLESPITSNAMGILGE